MKKLNHEQMTEISAAGPVGDILRPIGALVDSLLGAVVGLVGSLIGALNPGK